MQLGFKILFLFLRLPDGVMPWIIHNHTLHLHFHFHYHIPTARLNLLNLLAQVFGMTISGVEHRARTGLHANAIASTTGTRNHVSYIYNKDFDIFYNISGLYRQTKTDTTGQTRQTFINLSCIIFMYFYLMSMLLLLLLTGFWFASLKYKIKCYT